VDFNAAARSHRTITSAQVNIAASAHLITAFIDHDDVLA
jgi:hypothetical protein